MLAGYNLYSANVFLLNMHTPDALLLFLQQLNIFHEEEVQAVAGLFTRRLICKDEYFVREGMPCTEIAFIESGIFRSFYTDERGNELTYCFRFPGDFIAAYSSFITGGPSVEYIQAITPTEIWTMPKSIVDEQARTNPKWVELLRLVAEQQFLEMERRYIQLQRDAAVKRYTTLLQQQPEYLQMIPLQYLASYLGITQRHLSRIRKEIMF